MQNDSIDLTKITDITKLKALKADQYDALLAHQAGIKQAEANLAAITTRIQQVTQGKPGSSSLAS